MNGQLDLLARLSDPATSKTAAEGDRTTQTETVFAAFVAAGSEGLNAYEAWKATGERWKENVVSRRISSLVKAKRLVGCGTRPGGSSKQQNCWRTPSYMAETAS